MYREMPRCPNAALVYSKLAGSLSSEYVSGLYGPGGLWVDVPFVTSGSEHLNAGGDVPMCPSPAMTGDILSGRGSLWPVSKGRPLESTVHMH